MSTYDTAALWSATQLATDQTKIGAAGLSVRQRKLLTLLSEPTTVAQLAQSIALPIEDVHASLDRFAKLGLAQSAVATTGAFDPMQLRATTVAGAAIGASSPRMPMLIGIALAALAVVAAAAWMLRSGPSTTAPTQTQIATAPKQAAPAPQAAQDVATGAAGSAPAPVTATAATPASPQAAQATAPPPAQPNTAAGRAAAAQAAAVAAKAAATPVATPAATPAATRATTATTAAAPATPAAGGTVVAVPAQTTTPAPAPAVTTPVAAAPVVATPAPAPVAAPATVAAAPATTAPVRAAPAAAREIKLVTRVEPTFPRGFETDSGTVRARLQVDARGAVTGVDIIEANPPRVFDRNVRTALQQWRYEPTGEAFSTLAEIKFSR